MGGGTKNTKNIFYFDNVTLSLNAPIMMDYIIDGYSEVKDFNDFIHNLSLCLDSRFI